MLDSFGIARFADSRKFVMGFNTLIAIMITLLCIGAMAGWSTTQNTLKNSSWAKVSIGGQDDLIGLQGIYTSGPFGNTFTKFSDCASTISFCDSCQKGGSAALGLYLVSFFMLLGVIIGTAIRMFRDTLALKLSMVFLTFVVWIFTVAGFGNWNEKCYKSISNVAGGSNLTYSAGYGAAVCTWFFSTLVFLLHLLTPVTSFNGGGGGGGAQEATPAGDFNKV